MNARQRRGTLFMFFSVVLAAGVFVAVVSYVGNVNRQVGQKVTVYRALVPIDPYQPLSKTNLESVEMPRLWASATALVPLDELEGRRVAFRLERGTTVTSDMLVPPSALSPTERELAINVDAVTGLAGRVLPGDLVDIYAVFGDVPGLAKQVRVLVNNARIVTVGGEQTRRQADDDSRLSSERTVLPVTLALEPNEALAVTYASAFAEEVRLIGLPTGDSLNRSPEIGVFDAKNLGGTAVPEQTR